MDIISVDLNELGDILQDITLVNVRFGCSDTWVATPILFASLGFLEILIDLKKSRYILEYGEKIAIKFQKAGYEYILNGEIDEISVSKPATATVKIIDCSKFYNQRRHIRYETDLPIMVLTQTGNFVKNVAKNISEGGTMFLCNSDIDLGSLTELQVSFGPFGTFISKGKVLRKNWYDQNRYSYGVQFIDMSEENEQILRKGIAQYEKEYFKSLRTLKGGDAEKESGYQTPIGIFSLGSQESFDIKESLVKLGAGNFSVFHDFKFYVDFFADEKPLLAVIEADSLDKDLTENIKIMMNDFPDVKIVLILPVGEMCKIEAAGIRGMDVVYKPLIYNEFEEIIIRYL